MCGDIFIQRAAAHADVNRNAPSENSESIFEKSHSLKWTLITSESAPLTDNTASFQKGYGKQEASPLTAFFYSTSLSGPSEKLQDPSAGRRPCGFTQKPNTHVAARSTK